MLVAWFRPSPGYAHFSMRRMQSLCVLILLVAALTTTATAQTKFAHTSGTKLVTASGEPILLRGINVGNWLEPEGYMFHLDEGPQAPHEIEDLTRELIGPEKADAFWHSWRFTGRRTSNLR